MTQTENLPETSDPRWRKILLSENTPLFNHLTTQLMFSRVKMTLRLDSSAPSLVAAIQTVRSYFAKNSIKVPDDLKSLLDEMEKSNG